MTPGDFDWTHVASAVAGSGGATFFARLLAKRAIDELKVMTKELRTCTQEILIIKTELIALKDLRELVTQHDRKLIELDVKSNKLKCKIGEMNK